MATAGTSITSARILVVEDEPIIALDLERTFVDAGAYVVGLAYTLLEALAFARKKPSTSQFSMYGSEGKTAETWRAFSHREACRY